MGFGSPERPEPHTMPQNPAEPACSTFNPAKTLPADSASQKIHNTISKDTMLCKIAKPAQFCTIPKLPIHLAIWQVEFNSLNLFPAQFLYPFADRSMLRAACFCPFLGGVK
jgi:hypothetical protein